MIINGSTLKLPARTGASTTTAHSRLAAPGQGPGDPIDPGQSPGDPMPPEQAPGDPISPDHGPGDPVTPVHHVRYPLLKAFWRDVAPPPVPVVSTLRRRSRSIGSN